ncbi:MAG: hypothetical protein ACLQME_06455 [Alphaproteobacteria bacterium]
MPNKGAKSDANALKTTLPKGARALLDQLVDLEEFGDSHSAVIAHLVESALHEYVKDGTLKRRPLRKKPKGR